MALLGFEYPRDPVLPYWGKQNSVFNFCEEDYLLTQYVGELINTATNLIYVTYALHGIRSNLSKPDAFLRNLPHYGILWVGLTSALYHATLKNHTQWADDLSMLVAAGTIMHRVFTYDQSAETTFWVGLGLFVGLGAFSVWHCWVDETTCHSILFAIMVLIISRRTRRVISTQISDPYVKAQVSTLANWAVSFFIIGFGIWNVDNIFCDQLTVVKRWLGMPWSFVLEGHGWWHVFTGMGAYICIILIDYLTSEDAGKPLGQNFAWPVGLIKGWAKVPPSKSEVKGDFINGNGNGKKKA